MFDLDKVLKDIQEKGHAEMVYKSSTPSVKPICNIEEAFIKLAEKVITDNEFIVMVGGRIYEKQVNISIPTTSSIYECKSYFSKFNIDLKQDTENRYETNYDYDNGNYCEPELESIETKNSFTFYKNSNDLIYYVFIEMNPENGLCTISTRSSLDKVSKSIEEILE